MTDEYAERYREYVAKVAFGEMPSEQFLNRNEVHAGIVVEHIFLKAKSRVQILTRSLSEDVYGTPHVIDAAREFLSRNSEARLDILVETEVVRSNHLLLKDLDAIGLGDKVSVRVVPQELQKLYAFNFSIADGQHYRFEENREFRRAIVQFGPTEIGASLAKIFADLTASTPDSAKN